MGAIAPDREAPLLPWQHGVVFLLTCAVLITRRPDAIFHPQFWAEDGTIFFSQAYNQGWVHAMYRPYNGYFHAIPRIVASLALLVPLRLAPLVMNLMAIAFWALPVILLLSARSAGWGSLRNRAVMACGYLAVPNCVEVCFGMANSQWFVALSAFLLLVASPANTRRVRIAELMFFVFAGLTGPFCLFLLPIAVVVAWKRREPWRWGPSGVFAACCLIQACGLLIVDPLGRSHHPLGASPWLFIRLLGGQIYFGALLGGNILTNGTSAVVFVLLVCASIAGTVLLAFCFFQSGLEMRSFLAFAAMVFAASLTSSKMVYSSGQPIWVILAEAPGLRYWFFPTLACVWSILWAAHSRIKGLQAVSVILLCAMCFGVVRCWKQRALAELHYSEYVEAFEDAPIGTVAVIPENPQGWSLRLVKR
jgi:hypothetical protein